jgi:hypothetical protein
MKVNATQKEQKVSTCQRVAARLGLLAIITNETQK